MKNIWNVLKGNFTMNNFPILSLPKEFPVKSNLSNVKRYSQRSQHHVKWLGIDLVRREMWDFIYLFYSTMPVTCNLDNYFFISSFVFGFQKVLLNFILLFLLVSLVKLPNYLLVLVKILFITFWLALIHIQTARYLK